MRVGQRGGLNWAGPTPFAHAPMQHWPS